MAEAPRLDAQNPWPGLASFTEADRAFFRGREQEADELARLVRRERLTVLFGRSGLGKSSLLNAGLFPRLRDDLHLPVYLRIGYGAALMPRQQVWQALADACTAEGVEAPPPEADESMWAYFHRAGADFWHRRRRSVLPVLVFDHFEEVFTLGQTDDTSRAAAAAFLDELADLAEDHPSEALRQALDADPARGEQLDFERRGCKVVLSFREDFLAEVEGLRRRMPSMMRNRYRLLPMSGEQARAVIASGGEFVGPEVGERILGLAWRNRAEAPSPEEADAIEVDPALLSVICSELNLRRRAAGAARIEPALLTGAETEILAGFYERSLHGHPVGLRHFVEDELITVGGYRDSFAFDDALARPGVTREALSSLIAGRLLRVDERFGVRRVELTHDVLTRVVKDSRDARRAREAEAAAAERELRALEQQRHTKRRERWVLAGALGAAVLLVGAVLAGRWAIGRDEEARNQATKADAQQRAASAALGKLATVAEEQRALLRAETERAAGALALARAEAAAAHTQSLRAQGLERDAQATNLIVATRAAREAFDREMLLGAEVVRRHPERLDGQIEQLVRLVAAHRVERVHSLGVEVLQAQAVSQGRAMMVSTADGRLLRVEAERGTTASWLFGKRTVSSFRFSADGQVALLVRFTGDVHVARLGENGETSQRRLADRHRNPATRESVDGLCQSHFGAECHVVISASGLRAAVVSETKVAVWDTAQPDRPSLVLEGPPDGGRSTQCAAFDASDSTLVIGLRNALWRVDLGSAKVDPVASTETVLARSPDCGFALVATRGPGSAPAAWALRQVRPEVSLGNLIVESIDEGTRASLRFRFAADGRHVIGFNDSRSWVWPVQAALRAPLPLQLDSVASRHVSVVSGSADGRWSALTQGGARLQLNRSPGAHNSAHIQLLEPPRLLHFTPDSKALVAVGVGGRVQVLRLDPPSPLQRDGAPQAIGDMEFNAEGSQLAARIGNSMVYWNAATGSLRSAAGGYDWRELSPDGRYRASLVSGSDSPIVRVQAVGESGRAPVDVTPVIEGMVKAWAMSPDNRRLAIVGEQQLVLWDIDRNKPIAKFKLGSDAAVWRIAFHPTKPLMASAHQDGSVRLWSAVDGRAQRSFPQAHAAYKRDMDRASEWTASGGARALAFDPAGELMVSGGGDGQILVYDLQRPSSRPIQLPVPLPAPGNKPPPVDSLVFVDGSHILASGQVDGPKDLWDMVRRQHLGRVGGSAEDLRAVAMSPRARRLALKHANGTASLYDWDGASLIRNACTIAGRNLSCKEWQQTFREEPYRKTCEALPEPDPPCARASR